MIDAGMLVQGVLAGIITNKSIEAVDQYTKKNELSKEDVIIALLAKLVSLQSPQEKNQWDFPITIQPYPYEYFIDENWLGKAHVCLFVPAATSIQVHTEGAGVVTKNEGPGWVQLDLRGTICSGDSNNHPIIVSYRDDDLGVAF